jgi:DNA-binding NarL/FixJ family response regulator
MSAANVINLAIVESSRAFGDVLTDRLADEPDMRVLRSATSPAALPQALNRSSVDVLVCDATLFGGGQACHGSGDPPADRGDAAGPGDAGRPRKPAVVLLADYADRHLLCPAIRSGVRAWVPRDASVNDLIAAIRTVSIGGSWIPARILTELLDELIAPPAADDPAQKSLAGLTPRERDVLACLADGHGRAEVAARLHVSPNTVRTHVQSILSKLEVSSAVAAVALLRKANLTTGDPPYPSRWPASAGTSAGRAAVSRVTCTAERRLR